MLSASLVELVLLWMTAAMLPAFRGWRSRQYVKTITIALALGAPFGADVADVDGQTSAGNCLPSGGIRWRWVRFMVLAALPCCTILQYLRLLLAVCLGLAALAMGGLAWSGCRPPAISCRWAGADVNLLMLMLSPRQNRSMHCRYRCRWPYWLPWNWTPSNVAPLRSLTGSGIFTLGLAGVLVWLGWTAMNFGWPAKTGPQKRSNTAPVMKPRFMSRPLLAGLAMSLAWGWATSADTGRQAVTNWALGMTLLWSLAGTLWLPWLDAQKGLPYGHALTARQCPHNWTAAWPVRRATSCRAPWRITMSICRCSKRNRAGPQLSVPFDQHTTDYQPNPEGPWKMLWRGARPAEKREFYVLLKRRD